MDETRLKKREGEVENKGRLIFVSKALVTRMRDTLEMRNQIYK